MYVEKKAVFDFWNKASCAEELYLQDKSLASYQQQIKIRYTLEPYIPAFAEFGKWQNKKVLEIGVGLGAEHQRFAEAGACLEGIDLTENAINHCTNRFNQLNLQSNLQVSDAENLPYANETFDLVYSWGVLHHTPDTPKAFTEVWRVLKPGGTAKLMIYHKYSLVGVMLWLRYGLLSLKPWMSLATLYSRYLESPGTKAYTIAEAKNLVKQFSTSSITTVLTHGDLLTSSVGQRHRGLILKLANLFWPRWLIKVLFPKNGLFMLITAVK